MKPATLFGTLLVLAAAAMPARAVPIGDAGVLLQPTPLRREARTDAAVVASLPAGTAVDVRAARPGWVRVAAGPAGGWVRMFSVGAPKDTAGAAPSRSPRPGASHALLLGAGTYASAAVPPLPGVGHDLRSARELALAMGVPAARITVVRDEELTLDGMVQAVQRLVERVQAGDRVFVYYSGHGSRYRDIGRRGAPCVSSLLTYDGSVFTDSMLAEALALLAAKADKLFVFVDACFSGGAVAMPRGGALTPKFFARGEPTRCGVPTNVVARGLGAEGAGGWAARDNFIVVSAARDTEVAFEEATTGGFATRAYRDCALREARDLDGSGHLSVGEIGHCAQQRIDAWLGGSRDYLPHHLTILGNRDFVPVLSSGAATAVPAAAPAGASAAATEPQPMLPQPALPPAALPPAPGAAPPGPTAAAPTPAPVALPPPPGTAPPGPAAAAPAPAPAAPAVHPERTLRDIYGQRDARREVVVRLAQRTVRSGRDRLEFTITSSHAGYLYLLYAGSDGKTFDMLFPNALDGENFILPRRAVPLPRAGWAIEARGPAGRNHLLAIVADAPRDFSRLGARPAGPFASVPATLQSARDVMLHSTTAADAPAGGCGAAAGCGRAFGAALIEIREGP